MGGCGEIVILARYLTSFEMVRLLGLEGINGGRLQISSLPAKGRAGVEAVGLEKIGDDSCC